MAKQTTDSGVLTRVPKRATGQETQKRLYTVPELLRLTGMSRKQVEYWARVGLLIPSLRQENAKMGQPASFYSAEAMVKALVITDLRRSGFTLRQVQQVARNLEGHGIRLVESRNYLLTDGNSVYYAESDTEVMDILKHCRQMLLLIPIHEQVEKLKQAA